MKKMRLEILIDEASYKMAKEVYSDAEIRRIIADDGLNCLLTCAEQLIKQDSPDWRWNFESEEFVPVDDDID